MVPGWFLEGSRCFWLLYVLMVVEHCLDPPDSAILVHNGQIKISNKSGHFGWFTDGLLVVPSVFGSFFVKQVLS